MKDETKTRKIDELAVQAAVDETMLEQLIIEEKAYILACAGRTLSRHINKDSEEELMAIEAFVEAVGSYSFDKGSFLSFAKLVMNRRLIDELRKEKALAHIVPMDPSDLVLEQDRNEALRLRVNPETETDMSSEIETLSKVLEKYGFSFFDLTVCSPKSLKTKESCRSAVRYIIETELVFQSMRATKMLPIKIIEANTGVPRKILDRHRKYIIAVSEILKGGYRCLAPYVSYIKKEK